MLINDYDYEYEYEYEHDYDWLAIAKRSLSLRRSWDRDPHCH